MTTSVALNENLPHMLPWLLLSDVDASQQDPVAFDAFPPTMFMSPISQKPQTLPKRFQNSTKARNEQDWKSFFEQYRDASSAKTTIPIYITPTEADASKEKGTTLCSNRFQSSNQHDSKHVLNISSPQSTQQLCTQTNEQDEDNVSKNINNKFRNHSNISHPTSCDPCLGLTDFIKRKNKRQFMCERCGSAHSNCVKAKAQKSATKQTRNFRLNRVRSANSATGKKLIVICPNCGKRSHSSGVRDHARDVAFYRSLTWPLPLERIMEDEAEAHCCIREGCLRDLQISNEELFLPSAVNTASKMNDKSIYFNHEEDASRRIASPNGRIKKALIASICPSALTYMNRMKRRSSNNGGGSDIIHFVAMVTPNTMRSHPELMTAVDSQVMLVETSYDDLDNEIEVIVEVAKANQAQVVWIDNGAPEKHVALRKLLGEAGIELHTPAILTDCLADGTTKADESQIKTEFNSQLPENRQLNETRQGNHVELINDNSPTRFNVASLITAAVHIADRAYLSRCDTYLKALERDVILPASSLSPTDCVELFYHETKYVVQATKVSKSQYYLTNGMWSADIHVTRVNDGGLILLFGGTTYTTYFNEYAKSYQITVDEDVYVFYKNQSNKSTSCNGKRTEFAGLRPDLANHRLSEEMKKLNFTSNKLNLRIDIPKQQSDKIMDTAYNKLLLIMQGWCCYPSDELESKISKAVNDLITSLSDPSLPLLQMQDAIASTNGCLPAVVEKRIRKEMSHYASNITSMMTIFPGARIKTIICSFAKTLSKQGDHETFCATVKPILQVVERFSKGIRGNMKNVLLALLREYFNIEVQFQQGSFEQSVCSLLRTHDTEAVLNSIRSHTCVSQKNFLALHLIKNLTACEHHLPDDVISLLGDIANLSRDDNAKVALNARQVLRKARKIPYELRYNQLDSLFLSMSYSSGDAIFQSISDVDVFEILPQFFLHANPEVRMTAMEIYVRRTYHTSHLDSLQHHRVSDDNSAIVFNHAPSSGKSNSVVPTNKSTNNSAVDDCVEVMSAFSDLHSLENYLCEVLKLFDSNPFLETVGPFCHLKTSCKNSYRTLNVAMTTVDDALDDDALCELYKEFLKSHKMLFDEVNLHRVTFLLQQRNEKAKYFVFDLNEQNIIEKQVLRHIDPHLACELRLNRMQSLHLDVLPSKQDLHLYLASKDQEHQVHVLGAIRDDRAENKEMSLDMFRNDIELLLLEGLDDLEELNLEFDQHPKHIFLNVIKNMKCELANVEDVLRAIIIRYGKRLFKRKVKNVEICYGNRSANNFDDIPHVIKISLLSESEYTFQ